MDLLRQITIRQLLNHTGGWDRKKNGDPINWSPQIALALRVPMPISEEQFLAFMISLPLDFAPGTHMEYSNVGYIVLGQVVETVSGQPYEKFVWDNVLKPAGVRHAFLNRGGQQRDVQGEARSYLAGNNLQLAAHEYADRQGRRRLASLGGGHGASVDGPGRQPRQAPVEAGHLCADDCPAASSPERRGPTALIMAWAGPPSLSRAKLSATPTKASSTGCAFPEAFPHRHQLGAPLQRQHGPRSTRRADPSCAGFRRFAGDWNRSSDFPMWIISRSILENLSPRPGGRGLVSPTAPGRLRLIRTLQGGQGPMGAALSQGAGLGNMLICSVSQGVGRPRRPGEGKGYRYC